MPGKADIVGRGMFVGAKAHPIRDARTGTDKMKRERENR